MSFNRDNVLTGSSSEDALGFSRAVRLGPFISVSGTTASSPGGPVGGDDTGAQAQEALNRIVRLLAEVEAEPRDVVRTRLYLTDMSDLAAVAAAHAAVFGEVKPATTVVQVVALADPTLKIEIEADAYKG